MSWRHSTIQVTLFLYTLRAKKDWLEAKHGTLVGYEIVIIIIVVFVVVVALLIWIYFLIKNSWIFRLKKQFEKVMKRADELFADGVTDPVQLAKNIRQLMHEIKELAQTKK
ncbi:hypothetical protein EMMF5_000523 [Cystobasidiomycetes sp. EMM_F5]